MANSLVTIDMVTREALRIAHEKLQFIGTVDRQYDDSFAKTGAKIGTSLRVRRPNQYTRTQGSRVMDVQDNTEATTSITVATQDHVDMRFNSAELALSLDELSKRYIEPAVAVLASGIESDFLAYATKATYNLAGTAGTPPADLAAVGAARAKLNQYLAPKDGNRFIQMDSTTMGGVVNGLKGLFQDSAQIKEQYREGMMGRTAMADWYENDRMWTLSNGADVTISTEANALVVDGSNVLDFHTTTSSQVAIGAVFTINGVYACHPETKAAYPQLQQFTLVSGGGTSGSSTVSPAIYLTGPKKNVVSSTGANLTAASFNAQALTFVGAASTSYAQSLMYHKEAFQFITADLPLMDDAAKCVRRTQDGLSMRVWQASDIRNDELLMRIDILYGMAALRPEWACRITS
ncbi:MAG: P22 phage major capsid protein family protein [Methylobacter sp.]